MMLTKISRRFRRRPQVELLEARTLLNAGAPDPSFGGTGIVDTVVTTVGNGSQSYGVAVQPDLKVVVVGQSLAGGVSVGDQITVVRYNADGSLDTTFGSNGIVFLPISTVSVNPTDPSAAAIQPNGDILIASDVYVSGTKKGKIGDDWALVRLDPNGSLDTTFGAGKGYVTTAFYNANSYSGSVYPHAIQIQSNGQIVVAGAAATTSDVAALGIVRYNANGSLDTSFGNGGIALNSSITSPGQGNMLAIDSSGRIDVTGFLYVGPTLEMGVARYLPNGTLDPSFGTGGVVGIVPTGGSSVAVHGIALQSTGDIVLCGWGNFGGPSAIESAFVRLNPNGSIDTTFGANGVYADPEIGETFSIAIQPADDEIVAIGKAILSNGALSPQFWVTRVLANGSSYDSSFGTNGLGEATLNSTATETPYMVALAPDGKIVVTGLAYNGTYEVFAAARFLGDSTNSLDAMLVTRAASAPNAPDPTLMPIVLDQSLFLDSLTSAKRRHK
ncbi:MAG: delta-60 repeat domain-containing protein [Isosphaeraceae bacterium]